MHPSGVHFSFCSRTLSFADSKHLHRLYAMQAPASRPQECSYPGVPTRVGRHVARQTEKLPGEEEHDHKQPTPGPLGHRMTSATG